MIMNKKFGLIAYILMIISSVGYYSISIKNDNFIYFWIGIFLFGLIMLSVSNHILFKQNGTKLVYLDMLFVLWIILIPRVSLPYGISRLIMATIGVLYAIVVSRGKVVEVSR